MRLRLTRQHIITLLPMLALVAVGLALSTDHSVLASAADIQGGVNSVNDGNEQTLPEVITNVINLLLFIIGIAAVLMLIIGGFRYVTANGEANNVTAAKNIILYSLIGIVVSLSAFGIVNFVLEQFN